MFVPASYKNMALGGPELRYCRRQYRHYYRRYCRRYCGR
jgi:hypothetical protein